MLLFEGQTLALDWGEEWHYSQLYQNHLPIGTLDTISCQIPDSAKSYEMRFLFFSEL